MFARNVCNIIHPFFYCLKTFFLAEQRCFSIRRIWGSHVSYIVIWKDIDKYTKKQDFENKNC